MKKAEIITKITEITNANEKEVAKLETLPVKELAKMLSELNPDTQKDPEPEKEKAPAAEEKTEKEKVDKKAVRSTQKEDVGKEVDAWLENFQCEATANGKKVVIKTWEKIPTCRSLKVDGVTYFEIYFSANGVRLNAKSELIPEEVRPAGSNIIKNGLDLTIPTFQNVTEGLTKYADACRDSLLLKKAAKEKAAAEKAREKEVKAAEKAAKKAAEKLAKAEATKAAEKVEDK